MRRTALRHLPQLPLRFVGPEQLIHDLAQIVCDGFRSLLVTNPGAGRFDRLAEALCDRCADAERVAKLALARLLDLVECERYGKVLEEQHGHDLARVSESTGGAGGGEVDQPMGVLHINEDVGEVEVAVRTHEEWVQAREPRRALLSQRKAVHKLNQRRTRLVIPAPFATGAVPHKARIEALGNLATSHYR
eukprot:3858288-Prymnesium_polylepis.1